MAKGGYRGGMPMGGMNQMQMMKQAQKMQQEMLKMQQEMETKEYEAAAGGGVRWWLTRPQGSPQAVEFARAAL